MKRTLNLSIPTPCTEKWENFEPRPAGGFCNSCSKTVVDFTRMSDDQIIDFFSNKPAHVCGRLRADQLKSYHWAAPVKINPGYVLFRAGVISLFLLLSGKVASAQQVVARQHTELIQNAVSIRVGEVEAPRDGFVVSGVVKEADGQSPIPGANILLKGMEVGVITDADGRFTFPRKLNPGDVLIISFIGYETQEYVVPVDFKAKEIGVSMQSALMGFMGDVRVGSRVQRWWWKIKSIF